MLLPAGELRGNDPLRNLISRGIAVAVRKPSRSRSQNRYFLRRAPS